MAQWKGIRLVSMRMRVRFSGIWHCCELWCRSQMQLGSQLLWLLCRLAAAALIQPLAWELPHAVGVAIKRKKKILNRIFVETDKLIFKIYIEERL